MNKKIKNIIILICFVLFLVIIFCLNIFLADKEVSQTERRKLAQFPEISIQDVLNGNAMEEFEKYAIDQFVGRDFFRSIKSVFSTKILNQKDNNGLFEENGVIYKIEYPLNVNNINKTADKMNNVYEKYLKNMNVYYSIIPDKNYYLEDKDSLKINYNELEKIMQNKLTSFKYIDIFDSLTIEDYYKTDVHWKQENLSKVVSKIQENIQDLHVEKVAYNIENKGEFYGGYYGQFGIKLTPDTFNILTNNIIENSITYNYETKKYGKIYAESKTQDKYDMFLEGATPLIYIENSNLQTQKELILFRDSFASSLAPLLLENYKKITLIDLRYISYELLENYIEFDNQDVLFLYSTLVINQNSLK